MAKVTAVAIATIDARPEWVLGFLRDYEKRPKILTDNYTNFRTEPGADGPILAYHLAAGGRERDYRLHVSETPDGLTERDESSSFVNTWTVSEFGPTRSEVRLEGSWDGASGIGGFFERMFAPLGLRRIYAEVLDRLAAAARE